MASHRGKKGKNTLTSEFSYSIICCWGYSLPKNQKTRVRWLRPQQLVSSCSSRLLRFCERKWRSKQNKPRKVYSFFLWTPIIVFYIVKKKKKNNKNNNKLLTALVNHKITFKILLRDDANLVIILQESKSKHWLSQGFRLWGIWDKNIERGNN